MKRNFATETDPDRNGNFRRKWVDNPLALRDFRDFDREIAPRVVEDVGRRAIGRWLDRASSSHGAQAAECFKQADSIRRKLRMGWEDLIDGRRAA